MQNTLERIDMWVPYGDDQHLTVSTGVVQLTAATWAGAEAVLIQCLAQPLRVVFDGGTPSATVGMNMTAGTKMYLSLDSARLAKFIREGASDATVFAQGIRWS